MSSDAENRRKTYNLLKILENYSIYVTAGLRRRQLGGEATRGRDERKSLNSKIWGELEQIKDECSWQHDVLEERDKD